LLALLGLSLSLSMVKVRGGKVEGWIVSTLLSSWPTGPTGGELSSDVRETVLV